jgi:hypothetical protein
VLRLALWICAVQASARKLPGFAIGAAATDPAKFLTPDVQFALSGRLFLWRLEATEVCSEKYLSLIERYERNGDVEIVGLMLSHKEDSGERSRAIC